MQVQKAHELFSGGQFKAAAELSLALIIEQNVPCSLTPLAKCIAFDVVLACLLGKKSEAYSQLVKGMAMNNFDTDLAAASSFFMSSKTADIKSRFIFGLGSGRSGSSSLASILNGLPDSYVSHEHPFLVRWSCGQDEVDWHLNRMEWLSTYYKIVGDVSHWWLPYVEYILSRFPHAIFIATRRSRIATVESFLKIKTNPDGGTQLNHWIDHGGEDFKKSPWDNCYPSYENCLSIDEAISQYWEEYYFECNRLSAAFPSNFVIIDLENLSTDASLAQALDRFGIKFSTLEVAVESNVGSVVDGAKVPFPHAAFRSGE